jgi:tRNA (guanine-N7-)-methyltransferase
MNHPAIKSYVRRVGRMSERQTHAFEAWLPEYALPLQRLPWDFESIFQRAADTVVEIGFGMGHSLLTMAMHTPEVNFVGIEVHPPGIGSLVAGLHEAALSNVRVVDTDAVLVFQSAIADNALAGVQIFFPDPWPKKRHHKRRLIQADFVRLLVKKIRPGGFLHCATDWEEYAMQMLDVLSSDLFLVNSVSTGFCERPKNRPLTKFELRGERLGHGVWDLVFHRLA